MATTQLLLIGGSISLLAGQSMAAILANATLQQTSTGTTAPFTYSLNLNNTGTTTIGTFWYSWIPGQDYLATNPIATTSPAGWTANITHGGSTDGYAIQWVASAAANDLAAGASLSGFSFTTADDLASVSGNSVFHPTATVPTSFVYEGAPFSGESLEFQVATVPEPALLMAAGLPLLAMLRRRRAR